MMHQEKLFAWRGWLSAALIFPAIVVACLSKPLVGEGDLGDIGFDFVAWLLLGAGVFVRLWATLYIGGHKSMTLVTQGPYAIWRHPLYVGSFLILLSLAVFLASPVVLAAALFIAGFYAVAIIPSEERHAVSCFGDAYRQYCAVTPRFWPRRVALGRPGTVEIKMGEFLREFARVYGIIVLGAAMELLAFCRSLPWWPTPLNIP
ncbi:MAG: isoprenylcysteine carboxylmethyltransferase family protein [Phycisphaerae bacterium]